MTESKNPPSRSFRLNNVRLSFPALFKPRPKSQSQKDVLTYQASLLLPPSFDKKPIIAAVQAAVLAKWDKVVKIKSPIRDASEKDYAGYDDGWSFISAWSNQRPAVVDRLTRPITDESLIYPGCWVNCHLTAFAWEHKEGGKGCSFNLDAIQFVRDDERLDGRAPVKDVFEPLEEAATDEVVADSVEENPFL